MFDYLESFSDSFSEISKSNDFTLTNIDELDEPLNNLNPECYSYFEDEPEDIDILDTPLNAYLEYDIDGFRSLNEAEKMDLRANTKWPDRTEGIQGCKINDEGVIKYPCRNEDLEGCVNPLSGVQYEKRTVDIDGYEVEVVSPAFDSEFDVQLPETLIEAKDKTQFKECNRQLYEAINQDYGLAFKFTPEQIEQIKDGIENGGAPEGYTWHHDSEVGKMQLVDSDIHADSAHTGGKTLWGGGNDNR